MKQMEVTTKTIGENTFYIKPFAAFVAANISGELAAVVSPVLGGLGPLIGNGNGENAGVNNIMEADVEKILPALSEALSGVDGDKLEHLMRRLVIDHKNVSVCGEVTEGHVRPMDIDTANEVFCADLQDMFVLCFEVVKINFGGFFKKIAGQFGGLQGATTTEKKTNTASGETST